MMAISLTEDFRTVGDLERDPRAVIKHLRKTGRPVVLTSKGRPDVVMMDAEMFEQAIKAANLAALIEEAEEQVRKGQTRPAEEFFKEFKRAKKISG